MRKTQFAGLMVPEPGESISQDNGSFFTDRDTIDHLLEVGAKTHRHNGLAGLVNPIVAPGVSVVASGGTIPSDQSISVGYTLEDADGGETMLSNVTVVSTPPAIQAPGAAPSGVFASDAGALLVNSYFYVLTFTDGEGGETPFGAALQVERPPGFASGHIELSNLTFGMEAAGATGWRLYRATGGAAYGLLATGGIGDDTFDDDGSVGLDCSQHPPVEENTTVGINQLMVTLPSAGLVSASFINLYATVTGDFSGGSFLVRVPVASGGMTMLFSALELGEQSPPDVNLSIGGAHQIDPDTDILDMHWKRPVATKAELPAEAEHGDVRMVLDEDAAYQFNAESKWVAFTGGGGGGGSFITVMGEEVTVSELFDDFDTDTLGAGLWAGEPKDAKVEGGKLVLPTPFDRVRIRRTDATLDPAASEQRFVVHVTVADALGDVEILASYKDAENFLNCIFDLSNGLADAFTIQKVVGGEATSLKFNGGNVVPESGDAWFEVIIKGEKVTQSAYTTDPDKGGVAVFTQTADMTADGDKALFFNIANEFGMGMNGNKEDDAILSFLAEGVLANAGSILDEIDTVEFRASGGLSVTVEEDEEDPGHAIVTFIAEDGSLPSRVSGSAVTGSLASGASQDVVFELPGPAAHLLRLVTNAKARVRVYGDAAARTADTARAIGEDPEGDHGVQLDYVNDLSPGGGSRRLTPVVNAANLDVPPASKLYLRVTNLEESSKTITVSFTLIQMEA